MRSPVPRVDRRVEQLGGAVEALRDTASSGSSKISSGHCSRGRQVVARERVDVRGVASSSFIASPSARAR